MTKRLHLTAEEVLDNVFLDDDDDYDDPDEPVMEGSDDEFSDLDIDDNDDDYDYDPSSSTSLAPPTPCDGSPGPQGSHTPSPHTSPNCTPPQTSQPSPDNDALPTTWSEELKPVTINSFSSRVGPTVPVPDTPMDCFELFFSEDLQEMIVNETNRYARQVMGEDKYRSWKQVTVEELKAFLGFSILMGVDHLPSVNDYWSRDPLLHYAPISDRIPRWRFREISRYLHFVNNEDLSPRGDPAHDRLGKVRPLLNHLSNKFATLYDPSKHVAVDEAMIKFQGRSSLKQYMPMKPIKRGIKVWVLGDSTNGYFSRFDVYTGRQENREVGLGEHVVKKLTDDIKHKNHHVYFDNFFTSAKLLEDLERDGIYGCGTARKDRRGFPPSLKTPGLKERGESKTVQKGKVTASAWRDNKVVTIMSTSSQPSAIGTVPRRQKDGSTLSVPCPEPIITYNKYMGGVDRGDQIRGYYNCRTKCRKFYKYLFHFAFDVSITNAFIMYKNFHSSPSFKTIKEFRLQLARQLIGDYCSRRRAGRCGGAILPLQLQHFPLKVTMESSPAKRRRGRCVHCSQRDNRRTDSSWYCRECGVWLCHSGDVNSDCFYLWHKYNNQ